MSAMKEFHLVRLILILILCDVSVTAQTTRPEAERKLAHDIYKEFVEIQSGFTTGATTPVAQAAAIRLRAAGFPESDIFVGGANPKKANLVVRYHGTGPLKRASSPTATSSWLSPRMKRAAGLTTAWTGS